MSKLIVKCRTCRYTLCTHPDSRLLDAHGAVITFPVRGSADQQLCEDTVWYLKEDCIPPWISEKVKEIGWLKGKLNCPKCEVRIGLLDFVSGSKCVCGSHELPAVHLVRSKLDLS